MFLICVRTSSRATESEKIMSDITVVLNMKITRTGNDIPAVRELRDTYFVRNNTIRKMIKQISVVRGSIANTIPTRVDTPLPPLNFA